MTRLHVSLTALAVLAAALFVTSGFGWFRVAVPLATVTVGLLVWIVGDAVMTELQAMRVEPEGRYTGVRR